MKVREEKLRTIIEWSEKNEDVRVLLLTSSLVNPLALVDEFSDLDIEFVFEDNTNYISDKSWTLKFGNPIAMIEEDESCFNHKHAMKMLLYEDGVKVDFKLYSKSKFIKETQEKELPEDWDIGYKILIDKDGITKQMLKPTYQISIIKKPSEKEFQNLINDFWWDTTYVAKCLVRDEIFYAKFMSETVIRTEYLIPLIEWHIASEHNWNITTNKYGRLFKKYLNQEMFSFSYNGNGQLVSYTESSSESGKEDGESFSSQGSYKATYTWKDGNLIKVVTKEESTEDGEKYEYGSTCTIEYGEEKNELGQYTLGQAKVLDMEDADVFALVGMLGKASAYFPVSYTEEYYEKDSEQNYENEYSENMTYVLNTDKTIKTEYINGSPYSYSYVAIDNDSDNLKVRSLLPSDKKNLNLRSFFIRHHGRK